MHQLANQFSGKSLRIQFLDRPNGFKETTFLYFLERLINAETVIIEIVLSKRHYLMLLRMFSSICNLSAHCKVHLLDFLKHLEATFGVLGLLAAWQ